MSEDKLKQPYNAGRRIRWLGAAFILGTALFSAGWFYVSGRIDAGAQAMIAGQAALGRSIDCPGREVRGFPFRFGVFCDFVAVTSPAEGISVKAGALRSAAQFYDPGRMIIELDAPVDISLPNGETVTAQWSLGRASVVTGNPLPKRVSTELVDPVFAAAGASPWLVAKTLEAHMRVNGPDLDLAGRGTDIALPLTTQALPALPPLGADFDLTINGAAADPTLASAPDNAGTLRRLAVLLNADRGILVSGPWSRKGGLLSGEFAVRIVDADAVFKVLADVFPQQAGLISAFGAGQKRTGEKADEVELTLTVRDGQISMGLIPLGNLPVF